MLDTRLFFLGFINFPGFLLKITIIHRFPRFLSFLNVFQVEMRIIFIEIKSRRKKVSCSKSAETHFGLIFFLKSDEFLGQKVTCLESPEKHFVLKLFDICCNF